MKKVFYSAIRIFKP